MVSILVSYPGCLLLQISARRQNILADFWDFSQSLQKSLIYYLKLAHGRFLKLFPIHYPSFFSALCSLGFWQPREVINIERKLLEFCSYVTSHRQRNTVFEQHQYPCLQENRFTACVECPKWRNRELKSVPVTESACRGTLSPSNMELVTTQTPIFLSFQDEGVGGKYIETNQEWREVYKLRRIRCKS